MKRKLMVLGLDCAPPEIVLDRRQELPVLSRMIAGGRHGKMRSSDPPITIPAWMVMATGKDAGRLGIYGFRHRNGYTYDKMWIANSLSVKEPAVWDLVGAAGGQSLLVSVPPSYPAKPIAGNMVGCFITPGADKEYTYPAGLKAEIEAEFGAYPFDVVFRTDDRDQILQAIYDMTAKRFEIMIKLAKSKPWDLFWFVEIGVDRIQHAFWKYHDPAHHKFEPGNKYERAIMDYYKFLDGRIGALLEVVPDDTVLLAVSDHGAKRMKGAFCVNEWLIEQGDLVLKEPPGAAPTSKRRPSTGPGPRPGAGADTTPASSSTSRGASRRALFPSRPTRPSARPWPIGCAASAGRRARPGPPGSSSPTNTTPSCGATIPT